MVPVNLPEKHVVEKWTIFFPDLVLWNAVRSSIAREAVAIHTFIDQTLFLVDIILILHVGCACDVSGSFIPSWGNATRRVRTIRIIDNFRGGHRNLVLSA